MDGQKCVRKYAVQKGTAGTLSKNVLLTKAKEKVMSKVYLALSAKCKCSVADRRKVWATATSCKSRIWSIYSMRQLSTQQKGKLNQDMPAKYLWLRTVKAEISLHIQQRQGKLIGSGSWWLRTSRYKGVPTNIHVVDWIWITWQEVHFWGTGLEIEWRWIPQVEDWGPSSYYHDHHPHPHHHHNDHHDLNHHLLDQVWALDEDGSLKLEPADLAVGSTFDASSSYRK